MQNIFKLTSASQPGIPGKRKPKILFANFPADGHFHPLTGLAAHLHAAGYDIKWYSSRTYEPKITKLGIPFFPFTKAMEVSNGDMDKAFPERLKYKTLVGRLKFDIINVFIKRSPEYYADMLEIHKEFPFDILVADVAFGAIPFVKELMKIPVIAIGVFPLSESSKDLPPAGFGMEPSYTFFGKIKQYLLRRISNQLIFAQPNKVMFDIFDAYALPHNHESVFDMMARKSDLLLQSGTPGFEYYRSDLNKNIRFIGPLLPHATAKVPEPWFDDRLNRFEKVVLVTQGTVEKDIKKILVPTLEAFKNSNILVVATTGGTETHKLRAMYPAENYIIEDFIPFNDVMPYADVYVTNGGYGGVMLGIENVLPMITAGVHEGKNEICARVGYFKLGINLKTETPGPEQVRAAAEEIFTNAVYKKNVASLAGEFTRYDTCRLFEQYLIGLIYPGTVNIKNAIHQVADVKTIHQS